ncbi:MAG: Tm-1-like ATP-binding domain-containing protein [Rhodobacteraceae bacterium]|nr:Tm-1-like ATP-binding domain-containing protein [Paracoccaceae bacterium]
MARVLLVGTVETKRAEIGALTEALARHGLEAQVIDISLRAGGGVLPGAAKIARMAEIATQHAQEVVAQASQSVAAIGMGGGTGGEIAMSVLRALPATYPKFLITTLAFDPRDALADSAITLVPTLCDLEGLNPMLRQVFENTAAMVSGLARAARVTSEARGNIGVTTLGATSAGGAAVCRALAAQGFDATVFHANGYGGAAFARFIAEGGAAGVIDLNVHELGRLRLAGAHVPMPLRFRAADALPRVVLPGALNFIGLGALSTLSAQHRTRPHYQHSGHFTHVQLTEAEMADQARALAAELNHATAPCHVILPMGGFSHEDRPGGAIDAPHLRMIAAEVLEAEARAFTVARISHHINTEETAHAAVSALLERMPDV